MTVTSGIQRFGKDNVSDFQISPLLLALLHHLLVLPYFLVGPYSMSAASSIPLCMMSASSFHKLTSQSWLAFPQLSRSWDLVPSYVSSTSASTPTSWLFPVASFVKEGQFITAIARGAGALGRDQRYRLNRRPIPVAFHQLHAFTKSMHTSKARPCLTRHLDPLLDIMPEDVQPVSKRLQRSRCSR